MIDQLPQYIANKITTETQVSCTAHMVEIQEDISSDNLTLFINGEFISSFELFDEETLEEIAIELLDGQMNLIKEILIETPSI